MAQPIATQVENALVLLDALDYESWTTATELGNLLGLKRQAITPYIRAWREVGYGIESVKGKGHRLTSPRAQGNLLLTEDELYALFLSLSRSTSDFPETTVARLKRRLLTLLSEKRQAEAKSLRVDSSQSAAFFQDFQILRTLQTSFQTGQIVRLRYQGLKDDEAKMRTVLPVEFVPKRSSWYLVVFDTEKLGERHLRIDRISSAVSLPETYDLPADFRRASMHPWDFGDDDFEARLLIRPDLARWLDEDPAHPSQELLELEDGNLEARFRVASVGKFVDWLMGLRGFRLLGPEPVQRVLKERAEAIVSGQGTFDVAWEI